MRRHHVHLSVDMPTAIKVGRRHGQPVVFAVDAGAMSRAGACFYRSENGVWLVDAVPSNYLRLLDPIEC
jgi:putative RNA 2'-phosphotransferase